MTGIKDSRVSSLAFELNTILTIARAKLELGGGEKGEVLASGFNLAAPNFDTGGDIKKSEVGSTIAIKQTKVGIETSLDKTSKVLGVKREISAGDISPGTRQDAAVAGNGDIGNGSGFFGRVWIGRGGGGRWGRRRFRR